MRRELREIKDSLVEKSKNTELTNEEKAILEHLSLYDGLFHITSVHRDDLAALGYETRNVTDEMMETIAKKLADDYCNQLFHESLDIIAEYEGVSKVTPEEYEFIKVGNTVSYNGKKATIVDCPEYSVF